MCGRTCCTLAPELVPFACTVVTGPGSVPKWVMGHQPEKEAKAGSGGGSGALYRPGTNVAPTNFTPVLTAKFDSDDIIKRETCEEDAEGCAKVEYLLRPMMWGLVPPWHPGPTPSGHGLSTINARMEGVRNSKLYKPLLKNPWHRCVVVCDGFYEWKVLGPGKKQPYLVYSRQYGSDSKGAVLVNQSGVKLSDCWDQADGLWTGQVPMFFAGLCSTWRPKEQQQGRNKAEEDVKTAPDEAPEPLYSYTILTRSSEHSPLAWLHNRMPAILPNRDAVSNWLDPRVDTLTALTTLERLELTKGQLSWHPVSLAVGNTRNKDEGLMLKVELDDSTGMSSKEKGATTSKDTKRSAKVMSDWLNSAVKKEKK